MSTLLAIVVAACRSNTQGALTQPADPSATPCSSPVDISNDWDSFYKAWVQPVVHFGAPTLIVFAVLLTLSVIVTPLVVTKDDNGMRSGGSVARWTVRGMYWFGVLCLLYAAAEACIVNPVVRYARATPWTAAVAISLAAVGGAVLYTLLFIFRRSWPALISLSSVAAVVAIVTVVLSFSVLGLKHHQLSWLDGRFSPITYVSLLAVFGIAITSRARGIGIGVIIKGHDKTGNDDAGLGAFVRARLYSLGSQPPSGILITQQTDVSTLPPDALNLIPSGIPAKLAALFVSLFTSATPWRVDISEQFDSSIIVSVRRNGVVAAATIIRASALGLPSRRTAEINVKTNSQSVTPVSGTTPDSAGASRTDGETTADWTSELRTAAAAFILLELSKRYHHLKAGLSGATQWRSVALQVIASESTSGLNAEEQRSLLVRAVANDSGNQAAQLALLSTKYRTAASASDHNKYADGFNNLLDAIHDQDDGEQAVSPLELRVRFNLMTARANYAVSLFPSGDANKARESLTSAAKEAGFLLTYKDKAGALKETDDLWRDLYPAVHYASMAIQGEWSRWCDKAIQIDGLGSELSTEKNVSLLASYENACALIRSSTGSQNAAQYHEALDKLAIAVVQPSHRTWAQTDPSLNELHEVDLIASTLASQAKDEKDAKAINAGAVEAYSIVARFKGLIGDAVPSDFTALPPFAAHSDALGLRGIYDARQLGRIKARELVAEFGVTVGEATRWLNLTQLHQWIAEASPALGRTGDRDERDQRATQLLFLLLAVNLDSITRVRQALRRSQLRENLLSKARQWAVVAPGSAEIGNLKKWRKRLPICR